MLRWRLGATLMADCCGGWVGVVMTATVGFFSRLSYQKNSMPFLFSRVWTKVSIVSMQTGTISTNSAGIRSGSGSPRARDRSAWRATVGRAAAHTRASAVSSRPVYRTITAPLGSAAAPSAASREKNVRLNVWHPANA